mmetsp:Transcript_24737/g.39748  ORF Transcript_24737/g.39748 Transcript_24737/m.39748 type:complete len:274 (-) Transcript_24737:413-1234(-)
MQSRPRRNIHFRRSSPRRKVDPTAPFEQEIDHPLQNQLKTFEWRYNFKNDGREYLGQPQRYRHNPSFQSILATKKNIQMEAVIEPPSYMKEGVVEINNYVNSTTAKREIYTAPVEVTRSQRIHRFSASPSHETLTKTRDLIESRPKTSLHASEIERLKRKEGAGRVYGMEPLQKQERQTFLSRTFNRAVLGYENQRRIRTEYGRLSNMRSTWRGNKLKNIAKMREGYGDYMSQDHKHRFKHEFPHIGPQAQTCIKRTPKHMIGLWSSFFPNST